MEIPEGLVAWNGRSARFRLAFRRERRTIRQAMRQRPKHKRMMSPMRRFIIVGVMVLLEPSRTTSLGITAIILNEYVSQDCARSVVGPEWSKSNAA